MREAHFEVARVRAETLSAITKIRSSGSVDSAIELLRIVANCSATMYRPLSRTLEVISDANTLLQTHHQAIRSMARVPTAGSIYSVIREAAEAVVFPGYHDEIHFAYLDPGVEIKGYGEAAWILKTDMLVRRSTLYPGNTVHMQLDAEHDRATTIDLRTPPKTLWSHRHRLALAKLADRLKPDMSSDQLINLLVDKTSEDGVDLIEVHVYGLVSSQSISEVRLSRPETKVDELKARAIEEQLRGSEVAVTWFP